MRDTIITIFNVILCIFALIVLLPFFVYITVKTAVYSFFVGKKKFEQDELAEKRTQDTGRKNGDLVDLK